MSDLRKAAEMALEALESVYGKGKRCEAAIKALRQALAHEALNRMVAENQRLGLYDEDNLQTAIKKGTKAWADVPNPGEWVDDLRGNDTPEVTGEVTTEVPCKTHPDAPHGFDRNASHSADRYVCECEGWEPVDWEAVAADQAMTIAMMQIENKKEWVGLTDEDVDSYALDIGVTANKAPSWLVKYARDIEAALKEKNSAPYTKNDTSDRVLHKEWVGLTKEEFEQAVDGLEDLEDCWVQIEAKLKEKNVPQP